MKHGTGGYTSGGCRCQVCKDSHAAYMRSYKELGKTRIERTLFDRWTDHVLVDDGCWNWTGARNNFGKKIKAGYGALNTGEHAKARPAHRIAWEIFREEIPDGLQVLHTCDNPACVKPSHLWLGTQADNIRDMHEKGRARGGMKKGCIHWSKR